MADSAWWPAHWSVRTKISVVLLLPVLVAVALAEVRIQGELDRATQLSAARDRLPVLHDTIGLTEALGQEMVAAVAVPAGAPSAVTAAVDAKVAAIQRDTGFAPLPGDSGRALNTALGKLAGIRAAGAANGDTRTKAAGYNDVIATLGDLVPEIVPADVAGTAEVVRLLAHLRGELATGETYVRASLNSPADASLRPAAIQTAAEQEVLAEQAEHQLTGALLARFKAATEDAEDRLDATAASLPSIAAETAGVTAVLNDVTAKLASDVSTAADEARSDSLRDTALVLGALLGALAIALLVVRSLVTPVRRLRAAALHAAQEALPETVRQVREGTEVDWRAVPAVGVRTNEEIGQLARAFDDMHREAVRLAVEQADLRKQVSEMFMTLSRRSQSLVEQQLTIIEDLESGEQDPRRLDELFRIDHIATRLRRNGENLHVLAGGRPVRHGREPVPTRDLLRAATSEVKDYRRVALGNAPRGSVQPEAAADVVHILAELLENATRFSPPEHKVALTADRGADGGLLIEVVDQGLGMTPDELKTANARLAAAATVGPETTRRMGLFVVGRLAALHDVTVRLRATSPGVRHAGVTASVHVPGALVIADLARPIGAGRAASRHNGHARPVAVVPAQASTPIFEQVVTSWFTEPTAKPLTRRSPRAEEAGWPTEADVADRPPNGAAVNGSGEWPVVPDGETGARADRSGTGEWPVVPAADHAGSGSVGRTDRAGSGEWPSVSAADRSGSGDAGRADRSGAGEAGGRGSGKRPAETAGLADRIGSGEWPSVSAAGRPVSGEAGGAGSGKQPAESAGLDRAGSGEWPSVSAADRHGSGQAGGAGSGKRPAETAGPTDRTGSAERPVVPAADHTGSRDAGRADSSGSGEWPVVSAADSPDRSDLVDRLGAAGRADRSTSAERPTSAAAKGADRPAAESRPNPVANPTHPDQPAPPTRTTADWSSPTDQARQAAESALRPAALQNLSAAGLPTRRPGAQLAPGAALPRVREPDGAAFRDATAVRNSLSRHYQGMRAARRQTAARADESGKDGVEPR
ncbi:ATP-binding protein [Amycolatopsis sp. SID8362]|uniref:ATP-binding protein n=1 Tax=Amycolatopsis sp. SID8362 TaxID=2690346 RepID=UPI001EF1A833|nr:ATP-binding protein [Amycolatopsis sp. SID8362]